jgi:hypothetical protein
VHAHLVIARTEIKLREVACALEFIEQLFDHRDGKFVLDCLLVEGAIINTKAPRAVMLLHQEHGSREHRCAGSDDPLL